MITASKAKISRWLPSKRVEGGTDPHHDAADAHDQKRHPHGDGPNVLGVDAHEASGLLVVGYRPEGAPHLGAAHVHLESCDDHNGHQEDDERKPTDRKPVVDLDAHVLDLAGVEALRVGCEFEQQSVLDDDRQTERDNNAGYVPPAHHEVE